MSHPWPGLLTLQTLCPQLVPTTFPKNAYLSHSIRCHMQTVQKVTCNLGHRLARELAQQCFLQSVVYSHNLNSKMKERGVFLTIMPHISEYKYTSDK